MVSYRRSPTSEGPPPPPDTVHVHGPREGDLERIVSWPLGSNSAARNQLAAEAIGAAFADMNGHTPELTIAEGSIRAELGRVDFGFAHEVAQRGVRALLEQRRQLPSDEPEVAISTMVVSFPDRQN